MNGSNIQNHSLMLSEYLHNIQYIDITIPSNSINAFAGVIAVKSRDAIKLHQEKYNTNSVIPHNVLASDYLTDCHQALSFNKILLFIKKLAFDSFYPLLVVLKKSIFVV